MKKLLVLAMLFMVAFKSQATLYFYDGFDYAENTLVNSANTGGNWASSGIGAPTNRTDSLTYSGLPASTGGKVELTGFRLGNSGSSSRQSWGTGTPTTNMFASFLLNVASIGISQSNATSGNYVFQLRTGKANVVVSNNANSTANFNIGIQNNGTGTIVWDNNGGDGYLAGSTYFIVFSYTNSAVDGTGTWGDQLWVNPALSATPGTAQVTTTGINVVNVTNKVAFGVGNGVADTNNRSVIYVDELRVGSTWADVIPEESAPGVCKLVFDDTTPSQFNQKPSVTTNLSFVVRNDGSDASNVTVSVTDSYPWLTADTATNSFALLSAGESVTNIFNVIIASNAPAGFYADALTLNMQGTGESGIASNFSAQIGLQILNTAFSSISKTSFSADTNGTDTATLTVSNDSLSELAFSLTNGPGDLWFSYPSGILTIPANTVTNILITADGSLVAGYGSYSNTLSVQYIDNLSTPNPVNFLVSFEVAAPVSRIVNLSGDYQTCTAVSGIQYAPFIMTWVTNGTSIFAGSLETPVVSNGTPVSAGGFYVGQNLYGLFRNTATSGTEPILIPATTRMDRSDVLTFTTKGSNIVNEAVSSSLDFMYVFKKADFINGLDTGSVAFDATSTFTVKAGATWNSEIKSIRAVVLNGNTWYVSADQFTNAVNSASPAFHVVADASAAQWAVWNPETSIDAGTLPDFSSTVSGSTFTDIQAVGVYGNMTRPNGPITAGISTIQIGGVAGGDGSSYTLTGGVTGGNGSVSPSSVNVATGADQSFSVMASNYYRIASLTTNGTPVGIVFDNDSTSTNFTWVNVQAAGALVATFIEQVAADPAGTPYAWLAQYGLTNFDVDAVADQDMDGLPAWQEYIAGTDPTNTASSFRVVESPRNVLNWNAASGRLYSVYWSTNLLSGFQSLATDIAAPQSSYTNVTAVPSANYQIRVRKP